jgi:NAD(P)-dependent dehydrogenase (short-subunit alcohol dehydrogenase family)
MSGRFADRVALITGAGSGIGAATARRFAAEGGRVAVLDRDAEAATALAEGLPEAQAVACDVADATAVREAVAAVLARFGRLDAVVNAAGHVVAAPIEAVPEADFARMLSVHVTGTFLVCQAALPALSDSGGAIVNLASIAALVGRPNIAAYAASKGAVLAMSRQFAVDFAAHGVRVNCVAPGPVRTAMTEGFAAARGESWDAGAARMAKGVPLGRVGSAEEVAGPICFLLSDDASYLTGGCLVPDGGLTAM